MEGLEERDQANSQGKWRAYPEHQTEKEIKEDLQEQRARWDRLGRVWQIIRGEGGEN